MKMVNKKYSSEIFRLLKPGSIHLIWSLYFTPSNMRITPEYNQEIFGYRLHVLKSDLEAMVCLPHPGTGTKN